MNQRTIVFICSGNTCRSPLVQALAARRWGNRAVVLSAGLQATTGQPASEGALAVAAERGADLADHRSQPVNVALLAKADWIIGMTRAHVAMLKARYGGAIAGSVGLLGAPGQDLCAIAATPAVEELRDPFGGPLDTYRGIADQVERLLAAWDPIVTPDDPNGRGDA